MTRKKFFTKTFPYLMIAPAMVSIGIFYVYPMIRLIYLSLYDYNLLNPDQNKFIKFENYIKVFTRDKFYTTLSNTLIYTVGVVVGMVILSLLLALWINDNKKASGWLQMGAFTPHIISIVSISLVWLWLLDPEEGIVNFALETLGLPTSEWVQSSKTSLFTIILISIWHNMGYYTLIFLAGLQTIPTEIYEALKIETSKKFRVFFKVTLPLISPYLFFITIIMIMNSFKVFDMIKIMTGGGPGDSTMTLVYYIYEYRTANIGFSSTASVVLMVALAILTLLYFKVFSKKVFYQ